MIPAINLSYFDKQSPIWGLNKMSIKRNSILLGKILLLLVIIVGGLITYGCTVIKSTPEGGSGGTIVNGTLYLSTASVSSSGGFGCSAPATTSKVVAIDISNGSRLWEVGLEGSRSSAGFGCAPTAAGVAVYGNPAVDGDLVYIGGYDGKIYAISSSTRLSKQKYLDENDPQPIIGGPVVYQGRVYIGSADGKVYALGTTSLDSEWESPFETGDKIWSSPAIDGGTLYIGSFDKKLYALNASDGSKRWEFKAEGAIVSTPLIYNGTVYVGSFDRYFYAVDATDGHLRWKFMGQNWFWAQAVAHNNLIYAPCLDGKVYVLDAENGREAIGAIDLKSPVSSSPVLVNDLLIIASEEGKVYSLDTADNQVKELADLKSKVYAPLSSSEAMVYIHTEGNTVYSVDVQTGAKREFDIT